VVWDLRTATDLVTSLNTFTVMPFLEMTHAPAIGAPHGDVDDGRRVPAVVEFVECGTRELCVRSSKRCLKTWRRG
jgi:hypothetical protein